MNKALEVKAFEFAHEAHKGQKRKYTGKDYIDHPADVASIVMSVTLESEVIAAAYLHDVIEDCGVTYNQLKNKFGPVVADLVLELTEFSRKTDGNRKFRKELDRRYLARASWRAKTIKLADLISNSQSIIQHDPEFAKVYMQETKELLTVLDGDDRLHKKLSDIVRGYYD